ncbi:hypothetical protein [Blastococcus mobilis]|uniref:LGFP repeat-containing protein n=1 Tax=Blastococcus mobilis TaxID=1938746 RepID=A0A238XCW1_9ACTN|nr:hypothetical protein [Blastococcus mobilis]SNR56885.1 LGFP repeat-containing protein [Blastococcus mobilis]
MSRLVTWARRALPIALAVCTVAALLSTSSDTTTPATPELELAADTSQFDAGNIISDAMFFDAGAMTPEQISAFINAKGAKCVPAPDGTPCLKDYRQDTFTRVADGICDGTYHGAGAEWAAQIIWKVAQACSISPRVLLVLLQKEQALVTASGSRLTPRRYEIAAGMGCPDNAACDSQYYGFYNQVYAAARQYQRYATYPTRYAYRAGANNTIQWDVETSCGTSVVHIRNQATAGLYNYTPYRPNAASLAAGYGTGNSCSSYGNRNFWLYFTDWFGSTQSPGGDAILSAYAARGGAGGALGPSTSWVRCGLVFGGCLQNYQNGSIYWSPGSGAYAITNGPLADGWGALRWEQSLLGYPTGDQRCGLKDDGCVQSFQGGDMYWSPGSGAQWLGGPIGATWAAQRWEQGPLGYPTADQRCGLEDGGCLQQFQGGTIYTTPATGTRTLLNGPIADAWGAQRWEQGPLGYPTADQRCGLKDGGCLQQFQGGTIYTAPATGTRTVLSGPIADAWGAQKWEQGLLGYPATDQRCGLRDGGCSQTFQGGSISWSPATGAHAVAGAVQTTWTAQGAESGPLGYPRGPQVCGLKDGGCLQQFQGGTIYTAPATGTRTVLSGPIADAWGAQKWERGLLGYPATDQRCGLRDGGCSQTFLGGSISWSPATGAHAVAGAVQTTWTAQGAESGPLGYPRGPQVCGLVRGGCLQQFQGGTMYTTTTGTRTLLNGPIANAWAAQKWEQGSLGYPTSDAYAVAQGTAQDFEGGRLILDRSTGQVSRG